MAKATARRKTRRSVKKARLGPVAKQPVKVGKRAAKNPHKRRPAGATAGTWRRIGKSVRAGTKPLVKQVTEAAASVTDTVTKAVTTAAGAVAETVQSVMPKTR